MAKLSIEFVRELYAHMAWADARLWDAVLASPAAAGDPEVRERLQHFHMTQQAFLQVWKGEKLLEYQSMRFATTRELYAWQRPYYDAVRAFLDALQPARLDAPSPVPWARYFVPGGHEAAITTLGETLFQVTSHTTYHRAQLNTRLRALGAEPPAVDYIAWLWLARPATRWPTP